MCGCSLDSECAQGHICEGERCVQGCRSGSDCTGYGKVCIETDNSLDTCNYCQDDMCVIGCALDSNCAGSTNLCTPPLHQDCFFCGGHNCTTGCSSDANCPNPSYPRCGGGGGPNLCGCTEDGDCRSGYSCDVTNNKCRAPPGKVLVQSIKLYTDLCTGCTSEGAIVFLLGERTIDYQQGEPCQTQVMDLEDTLEFVPEGDHSFSQDTMLGSCYEAPLNSQLINGGNVTWMGEGVWTPVGTSGICVDWSEPSAWAWSCDLVGPPSGAQGTVWQLNGCDIVFSTSCP